MGTDSNKITDDVTVQLNGGTVDAPRIPDRPGDTAVKAKWVDYVVALGADRAAAEDMTRGDLTEYATRLGG